MTQTSAKFVPSRRCGWTSIHVLEDLVGRRWDAVTQAYMRALRPSEVRVSTDGGMLTSDAVSWRVTVHLDGGRISLIEQEVEVDLPEGVEHGFDLDNRLRGTR